MLSDIVCLAFVLALVIEYEVSSLSQLATVHDCHAFAYTAVLVDR